MIKIKTKELSILLSFYFHEVCIEAAKTLLYSFNFERGPHFVIVSTIEFLTFCMTWHLYGSWESCHVGWNTDLLWGLQPEQSLH